MARTRYKKGLLGWTLGSSKSFDKAFTRRNSGNKRRKYKSGTKSVRNKRKR